MKKRFVRPYGLRVRSFRTASPKPSDWEFEYVGLNASIRGINCDKCTMNGMRKIKEFENVPHILT